MYMCAIENIAEVAGKMIVLTSLSREKQNIA